jgi:hypothetical protein
MWARNQSMKNWIIYLDTIIITLYRSKWMGTYHALLLVVPTNYHDFWKKRNNRLFNLLMVKIPQLNPLTDYTKPTQR